MKNLKMVMFVSLVAYTDITVALPAPSDRVGGKVPAALGACSALSGLAATACLGNNQPVAGYALAGLSGVTGAAAAGTSLHRKPPADHANNMELGAHPSAPPSSARPSVEGPPSSPRPSTQGSPRPSSEGSFRTAPDSSRGPSEDGGS